MVNGKAPDRRHIRKLIAKLGGPTLVASWLDLSPQAVSLWVQVPAKHVRTLAAKAKRLKKPIYARTIRPDLYG
jgi:hypothetical protein